MTFTTNMLGQVVKVNNEYSDWSGNTPRVCTVVGVRYDTDENDYFFLLQDFLYGNMEEVSRYYIQTPSPEEIHEARTDAFEEREWQRKYEPDVEPKWMEKHRARRLEEEQKLDGARADEMKAEALLEFVKR